MKQPQLDRRNFLAVCGRAGIASALLPGVLYTLAAKADIKQITPEMIDEAAAIAGVPVTPEQKQMMLEGLNEHRSGFDEIRKLDLANNIAPALVFHPVVASRKLPTIEEKDRAQARISNAPMITAVPGNLEELAFSTVRELSELIRTKKVSSLALTEMYFGRLKTYDPKLHFVITLTEERALAKAKEADAEIAAGKYRGPLHGIPWGAKDLLAVKGYPTTWGAGGFEQQHIEEDATVVKRLDAAGAVLVAKLSLGALAMGDKWYGGRTRNPWNPLQGSSGSSAGSASATAAGCVGFAIGSETLGSISSPSTRCGVTGLRPTFGFVPRTGAMALSWSMDKLGPICRSVEDCALVMSAIYGPDGQDDSVFLPEPFHWDAEFDWRSLRVGYAKASFEQVRAITQNTSPAKQGETEEERKRREHAARQEELSRKRGEYDHQYNAAALEKLKAMGVDLIPVELPKLPYGAMTSLLTAEAAAAFDALTMTGRDRLLTEQSADDWPNLFRISRLYPAVEYIQANRARTLAVREWSRLFEEIDILVTPSGGPQLSATNLTGHPALILPNGIRGNDAPVPPPEDTGEEDNIGGPGTPVSLTFLAGHYQDAKLCAFARAYQEATGFHCIHPKL